MLKLLHSTVTKYQPLVKTDKLYSKMDCAGDSEINYINQVRASVPVLTSDRHKGQAGRIGVVGGSVEYTGAPYFAAISALKVGADLAHVFSMRDAAPVIKSYSPELIVHPVLDAKDPVEEIKPWLPRLHVLIIGPGLGRDENTMNTVESLLEYCKSEKKPVVIDADGLWLLTKRPHLIRDYPGAVLTPNAMEFSRLAKTVLDETWPATPEPEPTCVKKLADALGPDVVVVHKGAMDMIAGGGHQDVWKCSEGGSGRRCGGQGDLLSGALGTFYTWALQCPLLTVPSKALAGVTAGYGACRLTKECNRRAFHRFGRSMTTTNMVEVIHESFESLFEDQAFT